MLVRPFDVTDTNFAHLCHAPRGRGPIATWPDRDEAWGSVVQIVRATIKQLESRRSVGTAPASVGKPSERRSTAGDVAVGRPGATETASGSTRGVERKILAPSPTRSVEEIPPFESGNQPRTIASAGSPRDEPARGDAEAEGREAHAHGRGYLSVYDEGAPAGQSKSVPAPANNASNAAAQGKATGQPSKGLPPRSTASGGGRIPARTPVASPKSPTTTFSPDAP